MVGRSARAAAESAARAGFPVTALDAFADIDHHPDVRVIAPDPGGESFRPARAARAAQRIAADAAVYLSGFENHPLAVRALGAGRRLWGNPPSVLRQVRDPFAVARVMADHGFTMPEMRRTAPPVARRRASRLPLTVESGLFPATLRSSDASWLVKPRASGGGRRVRVWRSDGVAAPCLPRDCYLQAFAAGTPGSIVFVAAAGRVLPLGVSRQLTGEQAFGSAGFRYCGSILAPVALLSDHSPHGNAARLCARAVTMAHAAAGAFDLVGVNGIDFVARSGEPYPIEVNPRWCASMELVERASGTSVFALHASACETGLVPYPAVLKTPSAGFFGKAILFAAHTVVVGNSRAWLGDPDVRDVPRPGTVIRARQPICTVFASAENDSACHAALLRRAGEIYDRIAAWPRRIAC
jgi:predicted ATP-grasp superfamily ATP-dependent carboligase